MFFGSRSAQTPSESIQESASNTNTTTYMIAGRLDALTPGVNYKVYHKWRKVSRVAQKGMPHHSQIFVATGADVVVLNFGLFSNNGQVVFDVDGPELPTNPYHVSTSYRPNPVVNVTKETLLWAYLHTCQQCGPEYKLLHNNCQKFGRILMTNLGASHHRELFHP